MKAITQTTYGSPCSFSLEDLPKPEPRENELLVRVQAAAVNYSTAAFAAGKPFIIRLMSGGISKPAFRIPGAEIAGRVEAAGEQVTSFQPGDEVFADLSNCGRGGFAEYVIVPENALAHKPRNLDFKEAAALPEAAIVALQGLRDVGQVKSGQQVLIHGASGAIGTLAVQLAVYFGAEVTAVCGTSNLDLVRSIGADHVVDYTREDFSRSERKYDLIFAVKGSRSIFDFRRALKLGGTCVVAGGSLSQIFQVMLLGPFISIGRKITMRSLLIKLNREDLYLIKELCEQGHLKPVIDKSYSLDKAAEAVDYYLTGHARGRVVIDINPLGE